MCKIEASNNNFNFWTKFTPERYFWSKGEKLSITIELCVIKLVNVRNLTLK